MFYVKIPFENSLYILHSLRDGFDGDAKTQDKCVILIKWILCIHITVAETI